MPKKVVAYKGATYEVRVDIALDQKYYKLRSNSLQVDLSTQTDFSPLLIKEQNFPKTKAKNIII